MSHPEFVLAESLPTINESYFIFVYILVLIYCCFGLAVVCDVYFVPALQKLSYTYDLPPDIAGSTLMALGASVPELFASLIGVFITEDDIGTGSIIGSSCFNLIAVPAACAFVASAAFTTKLKINPMPVIRNSAFYSITILVLLLIIKDNEVDLLEALILLLFFVMYMGLMIFSAQTNKNNRRQAQNHLSSSSSAAAAAPLFNQQHQDQQNSLQSSLQSSYISTDSAIAVCNGTNKNSINQQVVGDHNQSNEINHHHHQNLITTNHQPIYGQFYFAKQHDNDYLIDEKTPLVPANKVYRTISTNELKLDPQHHHSYERNNYNFNNDNNYNFDTNNNNYNNNDNNDDIKLNLDIVMKNSTCLAKNNHNLILKSDNSFMLTNNNDEKVSNNHNHNQSKHQQLKHDENWVSSNWILVPMLPLTLSMKILTPCKFKNTCWTIWTFLVSIALIGGLTYVSVWMVHLFGQTIGIPETVAGMTILSWGTGIPELIASIVLIKKTAQADMAICNTIGSNVIDVSFCLSLPWIVKCLMNKAEGLKPQVDIQSSALPWTSFTLVVSVLLLLLVFKLHDWTLSFSVGIWLTLIYVAFVVVATYLEYSFSESGLDLLKLF